MENVQAKLDNFMRGVRGEKMDYVPIMMDFEPTYICEHKAGLYSFLLGLRRLHQRL